MSSTTTTTTTTTTPSTSTITGTIMELGNGGGGDIDVDGGSGFDMQLFKEIISSILLFMLLFGMSATVDFQALMNQLKNKRAILSGVIMQYVFMPVLGFASVMMLGDRLHPAVGITLLVVTSSPGGSYSNLICNLANADLPLSVAMTALSTILSIVMLPANLLLYSKLAYGINSPKQTDSSIEEDATVLLNSIDWGALFTTLGIVLGAILSGLYASSKLHSKKFRRCCNHVGTICGILLIVVSVAVSSGNVETRLWNKDWAFYVGVSFPALVGLLLANIIAAWIVRLKKPEVVTVAVECCYQNVGIATSVALSMFDDPTLQGNALCVPMYYGLLEALVLTIYAIIAWKMGWTKAPPDENICVAMGTTYEVSDDDTDSEDCSSSNDISTMQQTLTMSESTIRNGVRSMDSDDDPNIPLGNGHDVEMGTTIVGTVELAQDPQHSSSCAKKKKRSNFFSSSTKKQQRGTMSENEDDNGNGNDGNDDDWNYDHEDIVENDGMKKKQASGTPTMAMMTNRQRTSTSVTEDTTDSQSVNSSTPLTSRDRFATASMTEEDVDAYFTSSTGGTIRVRRINSVESLTQTTPGGALQQQPFPSTPRSAISFDDTNSSSTEYDSNHYPNTISPSSTWPSVVTSPLPTPPSSGGTTGGGGNRSRLYSREPLMPPLHE